MAKQWKLTILEEILLNSMPFEEYSNNFSNFEFEIVGNTEQKKTLIHNRERSQ